MRSLLVAAIGLSLAAAACAGSDGNVRIAGDNNAPASPGEPADGAPYTPKQNSTPPDAGAGDAASFDASVKDAAVADVAVDAPTDAVVVDATIENPCFDVALGRTRSIIKPAAGDLFISEWMADPTAVNDAAGEWVELYATKDVDLNGLQIGNAALGLPLIATNCLSVSADTYAVFARSADPQLNGLGSVPVTGPLMVYLNNTSGALSIGIDNVTLDAVSWNGAAGGISKMVDGNGAQCTAPESVEAYNGKDIGTPGAPNDVDCP